MKKLKIILPLLAVILGIAGAFAMKQDPSRVLTLTYYFTGTSGQEFDATKYTTTPPESCAGEALTCEFQVPDGYSNISDYMTWLNVQTNKQALYDSQVVSTRD